MNLDLFNQINDLNSNESNGSSIIGKSAFKKKMKVSNRNAAFEEIINSIDGLPDKDEVLRIKTTGVSDTGSIFAYIIKEKGIINEMYLSTWIISRDNIKFICDCVDNGTIKSLTFIVSKRLKELKKSNYAFLVEEFNKRSDSIKYKVCNCHAKTFSLKINEDHYTVDGSGNWTENPRIENYIIVNDLFSFNHNKEWMTELIK